MAYIKDESVDSFHYSILFGLLFTLSLFAGILLASLLLLILAAFFSVIWFAMVGYGISGIEDEENEKEK
jgi:hypothetical protein